MKSVPINLVKELVSLNQTVTKSLKKKGFVPVTKTNTGEIKVGNYFIHKDSLGLYSIIDSDGNQVIDKINLIQSAAILANNLALGIKTRHEILIYDTYYGHYLFSEIHCKQLYDRKYKKKDYDQAEILLEKINTSRLKKKLYYNRITTGFDKLIKIT